MGRPLPVPTLRQAAPFAAMGALVVLWMAYSLPPWVIDRNDFSDEAWPAYQILMDGDFAGFFDATPGYASFTILVGTPAALIGDFFGGDNRLLYILLAVPGALILGGLAGWLAASLRLAGRRAWWIALLLCAGVVVGRRTLYVGHPEDVLAAGAAVAAVVCAVHGRVNTATVLLVIAVLAKQWAVLAVLPAAMAAPAHRLRLLVFAGGAAALTVGLQMAHHPLARGNLTGTGDIFYQRQWWYPFGVDPAPGSVADIKGLLAAPPWLARLTHPLIVLVALPLSALWWMITRKRERAAEDLLGLLAILFLLRCTLDPWNNFYYHLPLVIALAAWQIRLGARFPWLALLTVAAVELCFPHNRRGDYMGMDEWAAYTAWTVPLFLYLCVRVYGGPEWSAASIAGRIRARMRRLQLASEPSREPEPAHV